MYNGYIVKKNTTENLIELNIVYSVNVPFQYSSINNKNIFGLLLYLFIASINDGVFKYPKIHQYNGWNNIALKKETKIQIVIKERTNIMNNFINKYFLFFLKIIKLNI